MHDGIVFVNYRRTDSGWAADRLAERLILRFGAARVFMDTRGIDAGNDFAAEIEDHLGRASAVIVLIGPAWLRIQDKFGRRRLDHKDDWVRKEICLALDTPGCLVLPILVDGAELPAEQEALPEDIARLLVLQRLYLRQSNSEQDLEAICQRLEQAGFQRSVTAGETDTEFTDREVLDVAQQLDRLHTQHRTELLPWPVLMGELDLLFNRKTFRFESLRGCPEQRWADRLDSAYQTLKLLQQCVRNVREVAPAEYTTYVELLRAVDKYCMQMGALLFESEVDYNQIEAHIGRSTFKERLPRQIKFAKDAGGFPIIPDHTDNNIEPHRLRAIALADQLRATA